MTLKLSGFGKFFVGLLIGSLFLSGSAIAVNKYIATNTPDKGYLLCANNKTRAVTFPNKLLCPAGTTALDLGAVRGLEGPAGTNGLNGVNGLAGIAGIPGLNGSNGANGVNGLTGPEGPEGPEGPAGRDGKDGSVTVIPSSNFSSDTAIKSGDIASITNPVKLGQPRLLNNFQYVLNSVAFPNDATVCASTGGFATGCKIDADFKASVDTTAKDSWITINLTVTNLSNETRPSDDDFRFFLVLNSGEIIAEGTSGLKTLGEMQLIKNGQGQATVSFRIPKSQNQSSLIFIVRSPWLDFSTQDNHFALR